MRHRTLLLAASLTGLACHDDAAPPVHADRIALAPAGPALGAEFLLDDPVQVPTDRYEQTPAIAGGPDGRFLTVWTDGSVRAARFEPATRKVPEVGAIEIESSPISSDKPAVAAGADQYLMVWSDYRGSSVDIWGARVALDGTVLDPAGFPISHASGEESQPDVVFADGSFLVVWQQQTPGGTGIFGARVDANAVVTAAVPLAASSRPQTGPALATDGQQIVVTWTEEVDPFGDTDIEARRLTTAGAPRSPVFTISGGFEREREADVAFGGGRFLLTWYDESLPFEKQGIYVAALPADDSTETPTRVPVRRDSELQGGPRVESDGHGFLVAWRHERRPSGGAPIDDLMAAPIGADDLVGSTFVVSAGPKASQGPAVAYAAGQFAIVYGDDHHAVARLVTAGALEDAAPVRLATRWSGQFSACAVRGDDAYLIVWVDDRDAGVPGLYARRVDVNGQWLEANPIRLPVAALSSSASIAWDGSQWLVVWRDGGIAFTEDSSAIFGARISREGVLIDNTPLALSGIRNMTDAPVVAWSGSSFLVAWSMVDQVHGQVVGADGARLGAELTIVPLTEFEAVKHYLDMAWNGSQYLLAYRQGLGPEYAMVAVVVQPDGTPIRELVVGEGEPLFSFPQVASDGHEWIVSHQTPATNIYDSELVASRVGADSTLAPPVLVTSGPGGVYNPRIAFDGANYVFAWGDLTPRQTYPGFAVTWWSPSGHPVGTIEISVTNDDSTALDLFGGGGTVLGLFSRSRPPTMTNRLVGRFLSCDGCQYVAPEVPDGGVADAGEGAPDAGAAAGAPDAGATDPPGDSSGCDIGGSFRHR